MAGRIYLDKDANFYIMTGGQGVLLSSGGYNGGEVYSAGPYNNASSGGATDFRYYTDNNLNYRIMVSGGGGTGRYFTVQSWTYRGSGGNAGGLSGYPGRASDTSCGSFYVGYGTQNQITKGYRTSPSVDPIDYTSPGQTFINNGFGYGVKNKTSSGYVTDNDVISGAGGWYGGGANGCGAGAGGGSSYISGMSGSIGVTESGTAKCSAGSVSVACSESWTGYKFIAGTITMIDGAGHKWSEGSSSAETGYTQMPNPSGGYYASGVGHSGNGYARITYLGTSI